MIEIRARVLEQALLTCKEANMRGDSNFSFKINISQRIQNSNNYEHKEALFIQTVDGWVMRIEP
jgi:hypothetical protein